jgi:hypothetical protein
MDQKILLAHSVAIHIVAVYPADLDDLDSRFCELSGDA